MRLQAGLSGAPRRLPGRVVCEENEKAKARAVRADRMLTGRFTGGLLLGALLGLVFWLTIQGRECAVCAAAAGL